MPVILTGVKELGAALRTIVVRQNTLTRFALAKSAHLLEREIKVALSVTSATGNEKRDTKGRFAKRGSTHSAPGEPPFLISGDLRRSVQTDEIADLGAGRYATQVGPTIVYGRIQELGGVTGKNHATTLAARPYVKPSLEKVTPAMFEIMKQAWAAGLRG